MTASVGDKLESVAQARPGEVAIADLERSVSYGELESVSAGVARLLGERVRPGQSVALISSGIEYILSYFGIVRAGCRAIPIESRFRGEQLRRILSSSEVALAVVDPAGRQAIESLSGLEMPLFATSELLAQAARAGGARPPRVSPEAELCVLFSSGSTGFPKGVVLTHEAGCARAELMARVYGPGKRHMVFTPLAYAYGLIDGTLCPLLHGGRTLLLGQYNPARLKEMVARFQPEILLGVPFIYKHLATMAADLLAGLPQVTSCLYYTTGEPLPRAVQQAFQQRYGVPIRQNYGLSEVSAIAADLHDAEPKPSRVGKLIPGVQIRLLEEQNGRLVEGDIGEVCIQRSHRFMKGYVAGTEADGRMSAEQYRTGDIGRIDEEGYLELLGRNDDFINVGGVRIHPAEVENVLLATPGVLEAAFVCEREPDTGKQQTRAYVVLDPQYGVTMAGLEARIRSELAPSRWPGSIEISAALPRTDTGKLVRRLLAGRKNERLVASAPIEVELKDRLLTGVLCDVSRDGCQLLLPEILSVGEELRVRLAQAREIALSGTCRGGSSQELGHRINVSFSDTNDRSIIERFVAGRN